MDQYGRMYAVDVGEDGETVARAVMGVNDDGRKGFNARLFLVNFPGEEYRIAVSGSPNPSPWVLSPSASLTFHRMTSGWIPAMGVHC